MTRYIVKITINNGMTRFTRDVVTLLSKDEVIGHFQNEYKAHTAKGKMVSIIIDREMPCGNLFEVL